MTAKPAERWPAQRPGDDFADRAVAAILRDRAAAPRRWRRARWIGAIGIAAVFVAAGAWARVTLPRAPAARPSRVGPRGTGIVTPPAPEPLPTRQPAAPAGPPARGPAPAASGASAHRRHEPSPAPDPRRKVRVPPCNCVQEICDCGEEQ